MELSPPVAGAEAAPRMAGLWMCRNSVRRISEVGLRCRAAGPSSSSALPNQRSSQRDVPTNTFITSEVYAFTRELEKLHPDT